MAMRSDEALREVSWSILNLVLDDDDDDKSE
jgi:hypothetical protein